MMDYYCEICDKAIKNKSKTKHLKSKSHLHMKSYVRDEHIVGDVYWKDFLELFIVMLILIEKSFQSLKQ